MWMWTAAGPNPSFSLGWASPASQRRAGRLPEASLGRSERAPASPSCPHRPTQKLVEGAGDRVVPAALEEGQAGRSHGFLVLLVEIKGVEGPLGELVAVRWRL